MLDLTGTDNITMNVTEATQSQDEEDPYPFEYFAPTLSQCFVIVSVGYLMAKSELFSSSDIKGISAFATYFAMPGIICVSLAESNFSDFRWELLFGIFIGKFITFVLVAGVLMYLQGNIGIAGLVAVFCVQSNDLPVGNPLMSALYKPHRPNMLKYLFLIPAMTVTFFVPIGNLMITIHRRRLRKDKPLGSDDRKGKLKKLLWQCYQKKEFLNEARGILKHPVVIATVLGLILNVIFGGQLPGVVQQPIKVAAATIPGLALSILGFNFVRKERFLISSAVIPATVLAFVKMVLTPVLFHTLAKDLTEDTASTKLLSDFALLYGIISPATAVFQSGPEFRKPLAVMSVALILTSFICFPVSYVVAKCTFVTTYKLSSYVPFMKTILFWASCVSIFSDVLTLLIMLCKKQWRKVPNYYIMYLILTQLLTCCGVVFLEVFGTDTWALYFKIALFHGGKISGYFWTGTLAVLLVCKTKYSVMKTKVFIKLSLIVTGISALLTVVMCVVSHNNDVHDIFIVGLVQNKFEYLQVIMTTTFLSICLVVTYICLLIHFKHNKNKDKRTDLKTYDNAAYYIQGEEKNAATAQKEIDHHSQCRDKTDQPEDIDEAKVYYQEMLLKADRGDVLEDREWTFRVSSLLLILSMILLVRLIANVFKLRRHTSLEVAVPLEYLQAILFTGQGILFLLFFGIDVRTIVISLRKWWRAIFCKGENVIISRDLDAEGDIVQYCDLFYTFYYNRCFEAIAKERRWKNVIYKDSFWGHQLVDWMISEGLSTDDTEAEERGQKLMDGGVIKHVSSKHRFYDAPYLYQFPKMTPDVKQPD